MKTKKLLTLIAFTLLAIITTGKAYAQDTPPAGSPVIELTATTAGALVRMRMKAAAANTPVWIETAPDTYQTATAGTSYPTDYTNYTPEGTSLKVYGNITGFGCSGIDNTGWRNPVSAIDASGNTGLQQLSCYLNQLTSLNVSGLNQLEWLTCYANQLTSLDVSGLTNLKNLYCDGNRLTSLDASGLTNLQELGCYGNRLTSLKVQGLNQLQRLTCSFNQLTSLDVSGSNQLQYLECRNNQLTSLNVSGLTQLLQLTCSSNRLTSLNVQGLTSLKALYCNGNQLQSLINILGLNQLRELYCYNNPCTSTTLGLDQIYCQLPQRQASDDARIYVSGQAQANVEAFVLATNGNNASDKNWKLYGYPATGTGYQITNATGSYTCPELENYPLWVAGEQVTSFNASAITGEGITGSVSYIHGTNTLTLNGATITKGKTDGDGEVAILSEIPLTINLIDENEILNSTYPKNYAGILINQSDIPLNITGDGSLNMDVKSSSSGYCLGIFASSNPVNLSCNSLKITSSHVGIASKELHITNGTLEVLGKKMTAINAETVSIYSNALLNEGDEAPGIEVPNLTLTKKYVYIRPNGTGLTSLTSQGIQVCGGKGVIEIQAPKPPKGGAVKFTAHIYNVSGMLVRTLPLQGTEGQVAVPAGIYIVRIGNAIEKVVVR